MKFLTLIAINLVVLGAFWFRSERSKYDQASALPSTLVSKSESSSSTHSQTATSVMKSRIEAEPVSSDSEGVDRESRKVLLEEYWELLLGEDRGDWCPSRHVDMFKEMEFIMTLDAVEAEEYLQTLVGMDLYWEDQERFTGLLINRMASEDPREAMVFMIQSDFEFRYEDYESVVRFWMDAEGPEVMDWFEQSELAEANSDLSDAFYTAYAEEDPYDFLVKFGSGGDSSDRAGAAVLLYEEFGAGVYEDLKLAGLEPDVLGDSFRSIGYQVFNEDPARARDWVMANRYSVDDSKVSELATGMLGYGAIPSPEVALENFEWAYTNGFLSSGNYQVQHSLRRLGNEMPEATRAAVERLRPYIGDETNELMKFLPEIEGDEEVFHLTPFVVTQEEAYSGNSYLVGTDEEIERNKKVDALVSSLLSLPSSHNSL